MGFLKVHVLVCVVTFLSIRSNIAEAKNEEALKSLNRSPRWSSWSSSSRSSSSYGGSSCDRRFHSYTSSELARKSRKTIRDGPSGSSDCAQTIRSKLRTSRGRRATHYCVIYDSMAPTKCGYTGGAMFHHWMFYIFNQQKGIDVAYGYRGYVVKGTWFQPDEVCNREQIGSDCYGDDDADYLGYDSRASKSAGDFARIAEAVKRNRPTHCICYANDFCNNYVDGCSVSSIAEITC